MPAPERPRPGLAQGLRRRGGALFGHLAQKGERQVQVRVGREAAASVREPPELIAGRAQDAERFGAEVDRYEQAQ